MSRPARTISRRLAGALVATALLAVTTFGGLNYVAARNLLLRGMENQLAGVGSTRAETIAAGTQRLVAEISAASADLAVAAALDRFTSAFEGLADERLSDEQAAALDTWYEERIISPLNDAGLGPYDLQEALPRTSQGRWLQSQYTVRPEGEPPPTDAGDGTEYSAVNADVTEAFEQFSESKGAGDVLLIDATGTIVYSLDKRNDVGTSLTDGPYAQGALARAVTEDLPRVPFGTTILTDFTVSETGRAALYAVSAVRDGSRVLGALAVEIPVERLNAVTSGNGNWESVGLGQDGDAYIVASDLRLQSEPRAWMEDPVSYLDALRGGTEDQQAQVDVIELFGSPAGIQIVDTEAVRTALDGEVFVGSTRNAFGESVFASSQSFDASGRQWVVVTEVPRSAALAPLTSYLLRILVVLAIVLPLVAGLGTWLARVLTKPIRPTVTAAQDIVDGDRHPVLDTARRDEYGDLARRLTAMAASLAEHEAELAAEYERTRQLLLAVLPPDLVDADGQVVGTGESAGLATVVAVTISAPEADQDPEQADEDLQIAASLAEQLGEESGLLRVRATADRYLFVSGISADDRGADEAVAFAAEFGRRLSDEAEVSLDVRIGLSTGAVETGVLDSGSLTFGAWGEPVRRALALASLARMDRVLIDATTAEECSADRWIMEPAHDVLDLDGERMGLYTLVQDDSTAPVLR